MSFEVTGRKYKYTVKWCLLTFQQICLVCNMYEACPGAAAVAGLWLDSHHPTGAHNPEQCIHVAHGHMCLCADKTHTQKLINISYKSSLCGHVFLYLFFIFIVKMAIFFPLFVTSHHFKWLCVARL